jgi:Flp pilus assembly protein TadG
MTTNPRRRPPPQQRYGARRPATWPAATPAHGRSTRDRGAVAAELAIAVPVLLLLVLTIVQFAVAEHARHVAQAVAVQAATAARLQGGTAAAGEAAGRKLLRQLGSTLTGATIDVRRGTDRVTVTVTGAAESVVPGVRLPIRATSSAPVERLVPTLGGRG